MVTRESSPQRQWPTPPAILAARKERVPLAAVAGVVVVLVLAWRAYRPVLALGHLGWDTWPLLLASRITTAGDLVGTFSERLMDGLYPHGDFYRPLLNLSVAFDYALWGTLPFGYHLTDLLLLLLTCGAVFAVGRRLLGDPWAALAACALFALHPLHFESLPVTARRGDALAGLFTLLALWSLPRGAGRRGWAAAVCALLAAASKESGALAAPLLVLLAFAEGTGSAGARARAALRAGAPALALLACFLAARIGVLGGMGGHLGTSRAAGAERAPGLALLFVPALLVPQPAGAVPGQVGLALAVLLGLVLAIFARRSLRVRRVLWVPGAWAAGLLVLSGVSGDVAPWYAPTLLPAYALVFGVLIAGLRRASRTAGKTARAAGATFALLLALSPLRYSGLFERYEQWHELSAESATFLDDLRRRIEALPARGGRVRTSALPERRPRAGPVGVHGAAGLGLYSVRAWAALELPERRVVVRAGGSAAREAGVVVVVIDGASAP